jgi:hypothetical protein
MTSLVTVKYLEENYKGGSQLNLDNHNSAFIMVRLDGEILSMDDISV